MLTIDRIAKIDSAALHIYGALHRVLGWLGDRYEARLVDAVYRVAEAKAVAISKAEDKISDLEDARFELVAHGVEAKVLLQEKYKAALADLYKELAAKVDALTTPATAQSKKL